MELAHDVGGSVKKYKQSFGLRACTRVVISQCAWNLHVGHAHVNIVVLLFFVADFDGDVEFVDEELHVQYSCQSQQVRPEE